jgi:YVTN family beta-propeller protein
MRTRIATVAVLALAVSAGTAVLPSAAAADEIYVSAEDGGEVAVIDTGRGEVVARIAVGKRPRGLKTSADGKTLYVALSGSPKAGPGADESKLPPADRNADGIGVVDVARRKLLRLLKSGQDPESFDLSRDGKTIFVSNEETAEMTAVNLVSGQVLKRVPVGKEPEGVTTSPDGKVVYVTSEEESAVLAVDIETLALVKKMATGPRPRSIAVTHDGRTGFVTDELGAMVTVLDLRKQVPAGSIKIVPRAKTVLGPRPMGAVMSPDGKLVYVSNGRGESVAVIDVARRKQVKLFDGVGARPWGIGVSADGKQVFTANGPSNDVSIIDAATGKVIKRVPVAGTPWGLAVAPATAK